MQQLPKDILIPSSGSYNVMVLGQTKTEYICECSFARYAVLKEYTHPNVDKSSCLEGPAELMVKGVDRFKAVRQL